MILKKIKKTEEQIYHKKILNTILNENNNYIIEQQKKNLINVIGNDNFIPKDYIENINTIF